MSRVLSELPSSQIKNENLESLSQSNNLAIKGLADFYGDKKKHIITCVTEHKCVLESCRLLSERGFEVTYLQVNKDGLIDLKDLESKINQKTLWEKLILNTPFLSPIQ